MDEISLLKQIIQDNDNIVFFGGAGVSTESGIPDFRSKDGLYNQRYDYPPEEILSHSFFMDNTAEFYRFYKDKMNSLLYKPNITHIRLASLEQEGKLKAIITQNIDGLHQKAGSKNVLELHGSVLRNHCMKCHKSFDAEYVFESKGIPHCSCGGIIKPDVVLYEEPLDEDVLYRSVDYIMKTDILIVAGTSLTVNPAASLIRFFKGKKLILINRDETAYDNVADIVIHQSLGDVFSKI